MSEEAKAPMGRPSNYRPEFVEQATKLCRLGATDIELADFFGVERTTIWRWAQANEDFCNALKVGKEAYDDRVARSLFSRATGYSYDAVKILQHEGRPVIVPYREHVPPDTTAMIFWLKNRRPREWRDRVEIDAKVHVGAENLSDDELANVVAAAVVGVAKTG